MIDMGVIDPVKVTRSALQNAASIAALHTHDGNAGGGEAGEEGGGLWAAVIRTAAAWATTICRGTSLIANALPIPPAPLLHKEREENSAGLLSKREGPRFDSVEGANRRLFLLQRFQSFS